MSLVIVGSIALDSIKTPFGEVEKALGGSAMYASLASSKFVKTQIVGVVGEDFPIEHIDLLKENDICCKGLKIVPGKTFHWKGVYNDLNKAETLETHLNVFADFNPELPPEYRKSRYVFLGNIDPVLQLRVLDQMENPGITACDTMNFWISGKKKELMEVIKRVDILFINEDEIKMLTGEQNVFSAAEIACSYGPKYLIIKRGEYGSMAVSKNFLFFVPVYPLKKVIDPTGAGDCFAGGFMGYLANTDRDDQETIKNAMIYGTVTASFDVESFSLEKIKGIDKDMIEIRKEEIMKSMKY